MTQEMFEIVYSYLIGMATVCIVENIMMLLRVLK
jgi:hypothetical protein